MVRGALVTGIFAAMTWGAAAQAYHCVSRVVLGYDGAVLEDWRGDGETLGRISFSFNALTGKYLQMTEGSAAAITGTGTLSVLRSKDGPYGTILAMSEAGAHVLKLDDSAHGVNYVRLSRDGLAEIGKCETVQ